MQRKKFFTYVLSGLFFIFTACTEQAEEAAPEESFTRIYDDQLFEASYEPIDVVQTSDDGYLILASRRNDYSNFLGLYLLQVDKFGKFKQQSDFSETLVHPLDHILTIGNQFYIVAMDAVSLQTVLVTVDALGNTGEMVNLPGSIYPLGAGLNNDRIVLQSYNPENKQTVISEYSTNGQLFSQHAFSIGPGSENEGPIIDHFTGVSKPLPFIAGKIPNGPYYFNGFYNYTFSLVFTDMNGDEPQGVTQGQHEDGGLSAVYPLGSDYFALSSFNFGANFLMPHQQLNMQGLSSTVDLTGNTFPELVANATVRIKPVQLKGTERILYGSETQNGRLALFSFDRSTGIMQGSLYLGYDNRNEMAGFCKTRDGGLAVVGKTYVAGRFGRIVLYKLSEGQLGDL